jgi:hypothetical protein
VALAGLAFLPGMLPKSAPRPEKTVMTISLGGTAGPKNGGMTMIGGRNYPGRGAVHRAED